MYKLSHHFADPSPCELSDAKLKEKAQRKGVKFFYHTRDRDLRSTTATKTFPVPIKNKYSVTHAQHVLPIFSKTICFPSGMDCFSAFY